MADNKQGSSEISNEKPKRKHKKNEFFLLKLSAMKNGVQVSIDIMYTNRDCFISMTCSTFYILKHALQKIIKTRKETRV